MFINDSVVVGVYFSSTSVSALINILLFYNGNVTQGKKPREGMYWCALGDSKHMGNS